MRKTRRGRRPRRRRRRQRRPSSFLAVGSTVPYRTSSPPRLYRATQAINHVKNVFFITPPSLERRPQHSPCARLPDCSRRHATSPRAGGAPRHDVEQRCFQIDGWMVGWLDAMHGMCRWRRRRRRRRRSASQVLTAATYATESAVSECAQLLEKSVGLPSFCSSPRRRRRSGSRQKEPEFSLDLQGGG